MQVEDKLPWLLSFSVQQGKLLALPMDKILHQLLNGDCYWLVFVREFRVLNDRCLQCSALTPAFLTVEPKALHPGMPPLPF